MKSLIIHEAAEAEFRAALQHYDEQRTGLGREFRREFEAALGRVRQNPQLYAVEDDLGVRHCPLHRFPYTLVYIDLGEQVWVAAVAHHRRRPGYWARRRAPD